MVRSGTLDPLDAKRKNSPVTQKADEGVGRGPGGPPYQRTLPRTSGGPTKDHWPLASLFMIFRRAIHKSPNSSEAAVPGSGVAVTVCPVSWKA